MTKSYTYRPKAPLDKYPYSRKFPKPIEVFCPSKYKDYHVRGQILSFPYSVTGPSEKSSEFYYDLYLLALVNPSFDNTGVAISPEEYRFGKILGRTKGDFQSMESLLAHGQKRPSPITVELKDFGLVESDYLKQHLSKKQNVILVDLAIAPAIEVEPKTGHIFEAKHACIYPFAASYFGLSVHFLKEDIHAWFSHFYDTLCFELGYAGISKKEFFRLLDAVGQISNWAVNGGNIDNEYIKGLYAFVESVAESQDPLVRFCFSFLDDMLEDLYHKKIISRCASCGNAFVFDEKKKYCSLLSEGKDCGKSARNKTYYQRYRDKVKIKKRQSMAEWRKYLKEMKVKKPPSKPRKNG